MKTEGSDAMRSQTNQILADLASAMASGRKRFGFGPWLAMVLCFRFEIEQVFIVALRAKGGVWSFAE